MRSIPEHAIGLVTWVGQARLDLNAAYEEGRHPPVYFRTWDMLLRYAAERKFVINRIKGVSIEKAVELRGLDGISDAYGMVWAKVSTKPKRVRAALVNSLQRKKIASSKLIATFVQADHICNHASVAHNQDGWLLIFPTISRVNYMSGAFFEGSLRVDPSTDCVRLGPLHFYKINSDRWPRNQLEFEAGMKDVAGQLMDSDMVAQIGRLVADRRGFEWPIESRSQSDEHPQA